MKILAALSLLVMVSSWAESELNSSNMTIPSGEKEIEEYLSLKDTSITHLELLLHYRLGISDRITSWLYLSSHQAQSEKFKYPGVEPEFFSIPSKSLYKQSIGYFGQNLRHAVSDNSKARRIMNFYYARSVVASLFLVSGVVTGTMTAYGIYKKDYFMGRTRGEHILFGTGGSAGLLVCWTVPLLFNRSKIHQVYKIYNGLE